MKYIVASIAIITQITLLASQSPTIGSHRTTQTTTTTTNQWVPGIVPTTPPTTDIQIGSHRDATPSLGSTIASSIGSTASKIFGGGSKGSWDLDLNFDIQNQKLDQGCYAQGVENNVTNLSNGETIIVSGDCASTGVSKGKGAQGLGKTGDITTIPLSQLKHIQYLGDLTSAATALFTVPQVSSPGKWNKGIYFDFKAAMPKVSPFWMQYGVTQALLKDRKIVVAIRTVALTRELAQHEGTRVLAAFNSGEPKILLEVWAHTEPSITGLNDFVQLFNIVLSANDVGKQLIFGADKFANAGVGFIFREKRTNKPMYLATIFNVTTVSP